MLSTVAALAALASPIFGSGPGQTQTRVLSPDTLRPVATSPAFPAQTGQVEQSPGGTQFAAASSTTGRRYRSYLTIYDAATGARTMRLRITLGSRVLSWLTEDRIAVVKRGKPTTVRIVSVSQRKVIHREVLRARLSDTARVGDRQVTLNAVKNGDEQTLSVFNADGVLERTVALPGMVSGTLHGRTPTGQALVLSGEEALAYAVDVVTGDVVRHDLDLPQGGYEWLEPTRGDMLAVDNFDDVWILDPATFGVVRKVEATGVIKGAGEGFAAYDTEGEADLVVYGPDGEQRWSVPKLNLLDLAAFGDRLYAGSGYDDVHIREYDLVTGKRVGKLRGRASLFEASAGRVRVPFFSSSAISED